MELRHLRYFVAVAEELNFRRAAERLFMAQPPLSQQIRQLEDQIGTTLFDRRQRGVSLTLAGEAFLEDTREILADVEAAASRARRIGRGDEGRLRIGFASSIAYDLLPQVVRRFGEQHPGVELELTELLGPEQAQALRERRIDVGLTVEPSPTEGVSVEELATLPIVVALPEEHALAGLSEIALADLDGEYFIQFPRMANSGFATFVEAIFARAGISPRLIQSTEELQTALGLVSAGLGFTVAPASVQTIHRDGLAFRPFAAPAPTIRLGALTRADENLAAVERLLRIARTAAKEFEEKLNL